MTSRGSREVYIRDLVNNTTELASRGADVSTNQSDQPSVAVDGSDNVLVAFSTYASFSTDDTNGFRDVYVRNVTDSTTTLVSRADGPAGPIGNNASQDPSISADGTALAFDSYATNLIAPADTNGTNRDVFVRVLSGAGADSTILVDRVSDSGVTPGAQAPEESAGPSISDDGTKVAFESTGGIDPRRRRLPS